MTGKKRRKGANRTQKKGESDLRDPERRQHCPCLCAVRASKDVSGKNTLE